jgi:rod shape-determining protein MreC
MFRLLTFLSRHRNTILFIILEVLAFNLIVSYNDYQRSALGDAMLEVASGIYTRTARISAYFDLEPENRKLSEENIELRRQLEEVRQRLRVYEGVIEEDSLTDLMVDSLVSRENFSYIPCRAIKSTTHKTYNYITLDKGRMHGVEPGMGVVSPEGIAGRVIRVSDHFSLALSALNVNFRLSARTNTYSSAGIYEWGVETGRRPYLNYVPADVKLAKGDLVLTSGYNTVFPDGFKIGTVSGVEEDTEDGFALAYLEMATNFDKLSNLYLVRVEHRSEVDSLEMGLPNE